MHDVYFNDMALNASDWGFPEEAEFLESIWDIYNAGQFGEDWEAYRQSMRNEKYQSDVMLPPQWKYMLQAATSAVLAREGMQNPPASYPLSEQELELHDALLASIESVESAVGTNSVDTLGAALLNMRHASQRLLNALVEGSYSSFTRP